MSIDKINIIEENNYSLKPGARISRVENIFVRDLNILSLLTEYQARSYKVIPLEKVGPSLKVALTNPGDLRVLDDLRLITRHEIIPVLAEEKEIEATIKKYYGMPEIEGDFPAFEVVENEALDLDYTAEALNVEAPAVKLINKIITEAIEEGASDIHLEPNANCLRVRYRVDGILRETKVLPRRVQASLVARLKILAELNIAERRLPQDGRIQIKYQGRAIDLRISTLPTVFGEKVVVRLLDKSRQPDNLNQLGFEAKNLASLQKMIKVAYGMVLFSGPTGSGKTTTLYAILKNLNTLEKNIVTIEDPVEY
ncbi:MAG TPA: type II secretion system protein GspE, partial [Desulfotomaculum sp.]|nr:type II secretion system protein GspE [Desulfotomaculum sp.]